MRRVGVLTGLAAEARLIRRAATDTLPLLACAGADCVRARREAEFLIAGGAEALISFGLAGGLDPRHRAGLVILGESVLLPSGGSIATDRAWREAVQAQAGGIDIAVGPIAGSDELVAHAVQKSALAARTGAAAVDMESHVLAEAASAAGLPLLVVRAIADTADQSLPPSVRGSIGPDGRVRVRSVAARLLASPRQVPHVLRLRRNAVAALEALGRLVRLAGAALFSVH